MVTVAQYYPPVNNRIILSEFICANEDGNTCTDSSGNVIIPLQIGDDIKITKPNGSQTTVKVSGIRKANEDYPGMGDDISKIITIDPNLYHSNHTLSWHNCFSFGNGVESNRIRDNFNLPFISNGVRASITLEDFPREEDRKYGLIYSGLYNSNTGTNNLNQFIMAEKITKDINPTYGSIQKLHTRDSDLLTLCQDKVLKILANKDAVYNADGNPNLTATQNVLGQTIPFVGEYGISNNPESFASEAYSAYFTDKVRGVVLRLSKDGLTPISNFGMRDWFRDNLKLSNTLLGSYDDRKDEYNLTIRGDANKTVSFNEAVKGWVSFKSFVPDNAISCANEYYTFKNNRIWKHHVQQFDPTTGKEINRNTFYNIHTDSSFNVILNEQPSVVKTFKTLNYEGSQSRIDELKSYQIYMPGTIDPDTGIGVVNPDYLEPLSDGEHFNLNSQDGWYVQSIKTDLETGSLNEFIEKEGKWFNYIRGVADIPTTMGTFLGTFDSSDTSFQGLGILTGIQIYSFQGCTDPSAPNYDPNAIVDDGSCLPPCVYGCMTAGANNYNVNATCPDDPDSCQFLGCTDPTMFNYDPNANTNDGSCIPFAYGCTDPTMFNYCASCNTDDGSCVAIVLGCIDPAATNYDPNANTDDGSCFIPVYGCQDGGACNYDPNVNVDDGSCTYCNDNDANNWDGWVNGDQSQGQLATCNAGCEFCAYVDNFQSTGNISTSEIQLSWDETWGPSNPNFDMTAPVDHYVIQYKKTSETIWITHNVSYIVTGTPTTVAYGISGLDAGTEYEFRVQAVCTTGTSTANPTWNTSSDWSNTVVASTNLIPIMGCLDDTGVGNPIGSWMACDYCPTCNADASGIIGGNDYSNCNYDICHGCMDPAYQEFCNTCWDPADQQVVSDGSGQPWYGQLAGDCVIQHIYGCMDSNAFNYDPNATVDDGSCIPVINGCTDNTLTYSGNIAATNYNVNANTDDGSCTYDTSGLNVTWLLPNNPLVNGAGWTVSGITAVVDTDTAPQGISINWNVFDANGIQYDIWSYNPPWAYGGPNVNQPPIVESQLLDITPYTTGNSGVADLVHISENIVIDPNYFSGGAGNWYIIGTASWPGTNIPDVTFTDNYIVILGCTDPNACNYDASANYDDGSCIAPDGCGDSNAFNYNANITCPDNANDCVYCETDPGVSNPILTTFGAPNYGGSPSQTPWTLVTWNEIATEDTNGIKTLHAQSAQGTDAIAYKVEYKYKLPGQSWSTSWETPDANFNSTCGTVLAFYPYQPGGSFHGGGIPLDSFYGYYSGYGASADGRYDTGAKWKFRIKNKCHDNNTGCTNGPAIITPIITIP